jgi:glucose-6-phosphate 1-dehydrogenase
MATLPLTMVIFGASGDLTARKLIPSLYRLDRKKRLPDEMQILGVARSPFTDDSFRDKMAGALREFASSDWNEADWRHFAPRLRYQPADVSKPGGMEAVRNWLHQRGSNGGRRLYYLAVSPTLYTGIVAQLAAVGLNQGDEPTWGRLIIEKPFGHDLASARALNRELAQHFREDQIYRIDHYLGKETVQNILVFRFANTLFEPLWNHNFIDHVQITVSETVSVSDRAEYYDHAGVLRDMFQNHLLQVLSLVAMEAPARYAADTLRNEKVKVLDAVRVYTPEESASRVVVGRYAGYHSEKGVAPNSRTPTYAAVELEVNNWRWQGVPFYLRSGKALTDRRSEVVIQFRCPPHLMFSLPPGQSLQCNRLSICIQPDEGIHLNFQSKVPDTDSMVLHPSNLEFHYRSTYVNASIPEAYEILLQDALKGDAALFMRSDEIERAWAIMDPIIAAVEKPGAPPNWCGMQEYPKGSEGPRCGDELLARTGREWMSLCHH